ncbi:GSCFA domain-containing protein [Joostella sp. CR20]|uniref:GSCFA domain-containing protein n=1 Tax=Joostella sp. CR20 TaxID=2804312 RepID=UPI00313AFED1
MKLQTQVPLTTANNQIDYTSKVLLMGSCFVENIGEKLNFYKLQTLVNPFGILFHPKALENNIERIVTQKEFTENDIFFLNERWHSFEVHSALSNPNKEAFLNNLNSALEATLKSIQSATHIVFTLGTAWGYKHLETQKLVANCHKVPQTKFSKQLLSVSETETSLANITALIEQLNPKAEIIFTVSPVRHLKDGFTENQHSKAHLISAVQSTITKSSKFNYFPAYEIMMDELRDYRFYAEDMIHPNKTAISYIWEKFQQIWISSKAETTMKDVEKIQNGLQHRPFNTESDEFKKFQEKLQQKIMYLSEKHPHITF